MGSDMMRKLALEEKTEENELNLGLSLGGWFGGKPKEGGGLYRSSSTAALWRDGGADLSLTRTSSLPAGSLEETKKRKGLMDVIQMEVMKKELEERKRCCRDGSGGEAVGAVVGVALKGFPGSSSARVGEVENQSGRAPTWQKNQAESSSPTSVLSSPEQLNVNNICPRPIKKSEIKKEASTTSRPNTSPKDEMPHVFTKGDGPNGKRVEGFLFKYRKGEEVRIVCVCHGSFLTPAEFVKHAGGSEVAHPLRRIVVVPSPSLYL